MFLKYFDQGLFTLPCKKASKATALEAGYSLKEWSENGIPEDLLTAWDKAFSIADGWGIALLCGKASGVIGLDIDSDDVELIALMPDSPCIKVGKTGQTRFFKYNGEETKKVKPQIKLAKKEEVEICSDGKYTLLPPSIHEDTKRPYVWVSDDDLYRIDIDELTTLPPDTVQIIEAYYAKKYGYSYDEKKPVIDLSEIHQSVDGRCAHGAHDRLKKKAALLIEQELPIDQAVLELLQYDKTHHEGISYFNDRSRGADSKADEKTNALKFYINMLSYINSKRIRSGEKPLETLYDLSFDIKPSPLLRIEKTPYPRPRGMMAKFQEHCSLMASGNVDAISLGGALSMMSILSANRFRTQAIQYDVRSNIYILNLARSGVGKEIPQRLLEDLLSNTSLIGSASYKSGTSIIQDLPTQQERLNIMDECAAFLKSVASGEGFQQEINDILSQLFTKSAGKFAGFASVGQGAKFGACWNPSVSILGSTTVFGFTKSVNKSMAEKGLLARFLTFWQYSVGAYKDPSVSDIKRAAEVKASLENDIKELLAVKKIEATDYVKLLVPEGDKTVGDGIKYNPILIPMEQDALKEFSRYKKSYFPKDNEGESFEDAFKNRFAELAVKCALLDAVGLGRSTIGKDSLEWAIAVVEACWANSKPLYEETSAENQLESDSIRVLNKIKASGSMTRTEINRYFGGRITGKRKKEILDDLVESELVCVTVQNKKQTYSAA